MAQGFFDMFGQAFRIAVRRAFPGQLLQRLLRRQAGNADFMGILIGQFVQREAATIGDLDAARHGFRPQLEQPGHFVGGFEIAVGMAFALEPSVVDGGAFADAGHDILQDAPARVRGTAHHWWRRWERRDRAPCWRSRAAADGRVAGAAR